MTRLVAVLVLIMAGEAWAHPPPPPPPPPPEGDEPAESKWGTVQWSTWLRVAYGVGPEEPAVRARVVSEEPEDGEHGWELGAGVEMSLPMTRNGRVRFGPWAEMRTSSDGVVGAQLVLAGRPKSLDMFWYEGEGVWIMRAGGNREVRTAALAYGYRAPWKLWGPWRGSTRYTIGVRMVASVTQSSDQPELWSATLGLETEPLGALRYLLGIKHWY